ncbi:TetR/AcrR family transcriptional regulator [Rhodococcus sp. NPDC059969]|uniref:TetR/AcrR family transcriptional regulator n=1 Tax=Rhodococcus sp. NPDC059969 TaxID=3347018 RepID=UPI0036717BD3
MVATHGFQRARRPEQIEARRCAILDAARAMLGSRPVADISLRELSESVGLAKSNVLRYFDSREAILLEVLDENWVAWLDGLSESLTPAGDDSPFATEIHVASTVAESLVAQRLLCELMSVMAGVLERNISVDFARDFKKRATVNSGRFASLIHSQLPHLSEGDAAQFAKVTLVIVAGLWPTAEPAESMVVVLNEMQAPPAAEMFATGLREGLINQLVGLSARAATRTS